MFWVSSILAASTRGGTPPVILTGNQIGFEYDSFCKAVYRFESGALETDWKGNNTLTNSGATANTTQYKEGAASLDLETSESDYLTISDANLDSGFPCKNGETNKDFAICCWIRIESAASTTLIAGKYDDTASSFGLSLTTTPAVRINMGFNSGTQTEAATHASALSTATWYHITATYRNSDKAYAVRVRDTDGATVGTDLTGTATLDANKLSATAAGFWVGTRNNSLYYDGRIDELVVFSRYISGEEATNIATNIFYANYFGDDSNCKALYRFDNGLLTVDSIGSNTLTNVNTVAETTVRRQGNGSADFELANSEYFNITDSNLDSGFPLKNGDTSKNISVCMWVRFESLPTDGSTTDNMCLFSKWKYSATTPKRCIAGWLNKTTGSAQYKFEIGLGYNAGASAEYYDHGTTSITTATWYHVTFSYSDSDKAYAIRVRDADGDVVGTDLTGTATLDANKLALNTEDFRIGAQGSEATVTYFHDGLIDECVVFNKFLTAEESTAIAEGTYS